MDLKAGDWTTIGGTGAKLLGGVGQVYAGSRAGSATLRGAKAAAQQELINADVEVRQVQRLARQVEGRQRAIIGASGLTPSGSAFQRILDSAMQAELEQELIRRGATIKSNELVRQGRIASRAARSQGMSAALRSVSGAFTDKTFTTLIQDLWNRGNGRNPLGVFDNPVEQGLP